MFVFEITSMKRRKARLVGINFPKSKPSRSIDISLDHLFDHVFSFFLPASPDRNGGELWASYSFTWRVNNFARKPRVRSRLDRSGAFVFGPLAQYGNSSNREKCSINNVPQLLPSKHAFSWRANCARTSPLLEHTRATIVSDFPDSLVHTPPSLSCSLIIFVPLSMFFHLFFHYVIYESILRLIPFRWIFDQLFFFFSFEFIWFADARLTTKFNDFSISIDASNAIMQIHIIIIYFLIQVLIQVSSGIIFFIVRTRLNTCPARPRVTVNFLRFPFSKSCSTEVYDRCVMFADKSSWPANADPLSPSSSSPLHLHAIPSTLFLRFSFSRFLPSYRYPR